MRRALFLLIILFSATHLNADPRTWGTQGLPIRGEAPLYMQAAASDPMGRSLVVWKDCATGYGDIYGQLLDANSTPMWEENGRLLVGGPAAATDVKLAIAGDSFLLLWGEGQFDWYAEEIWAQRFEFDGEPIWPQNGGHGVRVTHPTATYPTVSRYHLAADGSVALLYVDSDLWHESSDMYLQWLLADGTVLWPAGFPFFEEQCLRALGLAFTEDNGLFLVWRMCYGDLSSHMARYSAGGVLEWESIFAGEQVALTRMTALADRDEGYYVAAYGNWEPDEPEALFLQRYDPNGNPTWVEGPVTVTSSWENPAHLKLIANIDDEDTSGVVVIWSSWTIPPDTTRMKVQRISANGQLLWPTEGVQLCYDTVEWYGGQAENLTSDLRGGLAGFIQPGAWNGQIHQLPLFATRVSETGQLMWGTPCGVMIEDGLDTPSNPAMSVNVTSMVISWGEQFTPRELRTHRLDLETGEYLPPQQGAVWAEGLGGSVNGIRSITLSGGSAAVVWNDARNPYSQNHLYFQFVDANGEFSFEPNGRAVTANDTMTSGFSLDSYDLCSDGTGGFFVAYDAGVSRTDHIRVARIAADGSRAGDSAGVDLAHGSNSIAMYNPRCVPDGEYGCYVVWNREVDFQSADVYALRVDSMLECVWAEPIILSVPEDDAVIEDAASASDGSCIITWRTGQPTEFDVHAAKVTPSGVIAWTVPLCTLEENQFESSVVCDSEGQIYVAWSDSRPGLQGRQVFGQRLSSDGEPAFAEHGIQLTPSEASGAVPWLALDSADRLYLVWMAGTILDLDIYALRLDTLFQPQWPVEGVAVATGPLSQRLTSVAPDEEGGVFITWTEYGEQLNGSTIRGKHLDEGGDVADDYWAGERGGIICDTNQSQDNSSTVIGVNSGQFYCFWFDNRTAHQVYGQYIDESLFSGPQKPLVPEFALGPNYPNPFNAQTNFEFELPMAGRVTLKLYNLLGQVAATVAEGMMEAGRHTVAFEAGNLASGIYVAELAAGGQAARQKIVLLK